MTVSNSAPVSSVVLSRYVGALIDLAEESKSVEKIQKDLNDMVSMVEGSDELAQVIFSPLIAKEKQEKIISEIATKAKLDKLTKNFLSVLVENRRLNALLSMVEWFNKEVSKRSGEVSVRVEVASKLSAAQEKEVQAKISKVIGSKVSIEAIVTPGILGGMIVTVGSYMVDDSVRRKLERLSVALKQTSNSNTIQNLKEVI